MLLDAFLFFRFIIVSTRSDSLSEQVDFSFKFLSERALIDDFRLLRPLRLKKLKGEEEEEASVSRQMLFSWTMDKNRRWSIN